MKDMMTNKEYLALPYTMIVKWNVDDEVYVARVKEIDGCTGHGSSEAEALAMLRDNLSEWVSLCLETGDSIPVPTEDDILPSGKWLQRVPKSLHKRLIECAEGEGVSLNTYVTTCLARSVGSADANVMQSTPAEIPTLQASEHHLLGQCFSPPPFYGGGEPAGIYIQAENKLGAETLIVKSVNFGVISSTAGSPFLISLDYPAGQASKHSKWKNERNDRDEEKSYQSPAYA